MVYRLKDTIHHGGEGTWRELETAGHVASGVRSRGRWMLVFRCLPVFILSKTLAHRMVLPTVRMSLPAQLD